MVLLGHIAVVSVFVEPNVKFISQTGVGGLEADRRKARAPQHDRLRDI